MSLFERLKNKRYDLVEKRKQRDNSYLFDDNKNNSTSRKRIKSAISDLNATQPGETPKIETGTYTFKKTKRKSTPSITRGSGVGPTERINPDDIKTQQTQDKIVQQRVKSAQKSGNIADFSNKTIEGAPDTKTLIRGKEGETIANPVKPTKKTVSKTSGSTQISGVKDTDLEKLVKTEPKTRTVKQSEVSKKAKDFTKKINKNRVKYDRSKILQKPEYYKQKYDKLAAKRKEYGFTRDPKTKQFTPSKEGIKRYATKSAQLSSGSNLPVKVTKKQLATAKVNMTKEYGGKGGVYKAPNKTFAQIKAEYADKKAEKKLKSATRKIEKKFAKELPAKQKLAKTFAPATKADRQFYKAGRKITKILPKKAAPVAKKGLKFLTKLGTPGRILGATGLALLSPGVRKTVTKVATAGLAGAGIGALAPKPKKPIAPSVKKVGINLSQKN